MATARSGGDGARWPDHLRGTSPKSWLLRQKWARLNKQNEHWMCCIVGREGMGKSYTAIKLANLIDPGFSVEQIMSEPEDLLGRLQSEDFERGQVFVFDEAGVALGNRTWAEKAQVKFNQALQLIRSHNLGIVFTLPRVGELDTQAKGRLQSAYEIVKKEDGDFVEGHWWEADVDRMDFATGRDDVWWKKPRYSGHKLETIRFTPPRDGLAERYEKMKAEFQEKFYEETLKEFGEAVDDEEAVSVDDIAESIETNEDLAAFVSWHGGHHKWIIDKDRLRDEYDLKHVEAKNLKNKLRGRSDLEPAEAGECTQRAGSSTQ